MGTNTQKGPSLDAPVTIEGFFENAGSMQVNSSNIPVSNSGWLWNQGTLALSAASIDAQSGYVTDCYGGVLSLDATSQVIIENPATLYLFSDSTISLAGSDGLNVQGAVDIDGTPLLPQIDASASVTEGQAFTLNLSGGPGSTIGPVTINPYTINWGDGSTSDSSVTAHIFGSGTTGAEVSLTATTQPTANLPALTATSQPVVVLVVPPLPTLSAAISYDLNSNPTVTLSWSCDSSTVVGFELESKLDGPDAQGVIHNFSLVSTPGPGSASWSLLGLLPGRQYEYRIRADYSDGTVSDYAMSTIDVPALAPAPTEPSLPAPVITSETLLSGGGSYDGETDRMSWTVDFASAHHVSMGPEGGVVFVDLTRADDP